MDARPKELPNMVICLDLTTRTDCPHAEGLGKHAVIRNEAVLRQVAAD